MIKLKHVAVTRSSRQVEDVGCLSDDDYEVKSGTLRPIMSTILHTFLRRGRSTRRTTVAQRHKFLKAMMAQILYIGLSSSVAAISRAGVLALHGTVVVAIGRHTQTLL
jgi:hypothetical protein